MKLSEELNEAILHYQQGVATAAEKQLVEDLYSSFDRENTIVDIGIIGDRNNLEKESLALIQTRIAQQRDVAPVVRMRPLKKLGIAAAVLIIITAAMYRWFEPAPTQPLPPIAKTDVAPGGNKAVLTLSDGRRIVLNDAANGMLANEGTSVVSKTKDGELEYKSAIGNRESAIVAYNTLATPRGGQYQLVLPDGSKVWLNAASSITYPAAFTGDERSVNITGEAYFEVTKDAKKPFIVNIPGGTVEVLGTHFNVNAYDDEEDVRTTLLEGSVKVTNRKTANVKRERPNEFSAVLKPGEEAVMAANSPLTIHHSPDVEQAVAWLHGQLSMKYIDVAAFMRQVSRWYDVDVVFEGEVPRMSFSGSISKTVNLSLVLMALNDNGLHVSLVNGKLIVKK
jgi:ferric-dicitrate binding protein FerR (iron transport regulator)